MSAPITKLAIEAASPHELAAILRRIADEAETNPMLWQPKNPVRVELSTTLRGETVKVCGVVW